MRRTWTGIVAASVVCLAVVCAAPLTHSAGATPLPVQASDPASSVEETVPPFDDSGPVGIWPWLVAGQGTDSRDHGSVSDPLEVRWTFVVTGVPEGTEYYLWATFVEAGEIEEVATGPCTIVTGGHDILAGADAHLILPSVEFVEGVVFELAGVEVVPAPEPQPDPEPDSSAEVPAAQTVDPVVQAQSRRASRAPAAAAVDAGADEPFLPYTGSNEALPVLAFVCAVLGAALRRAAALRS